MRNCLFWQLLSLVDPLRDHILVITDLRNTDKSRFVVKGIQFAAKAANTRVELRMSRAFRQTTFSLLRISRLVRSLLSAADVH